MLVLFLTTTISCSQEDADVIIHTDKGDMKVKLYDKTPEHKENFLKLARKGFYDSLLFHRVIEKFMIQGGDPESKGAAPDQKLGQGGPGYLIPAEFDTSLFHKKGALAAARKGDRVNPEKKSSGSQFYIVHGKTYSDQQLNRIEQKTGHTFPEYQRKIYKTKGGTPQLDQQYTVFGEVTEGMEVIDKIASLKTNRQNRPKEDIKMWMEVVE
jgi:peptidyl-prolyl cis-trans isomerase B (cyclophilin B)